MFSQQIKIVSIFIVIVLRRVFSSRTTHWNIFLYSFSIYSVFLLDELHIHDFVSNSSNKLKDVKFLYECICNFEVKCCARFGISICVPVSWFQGVAIMSPDHRQLVPTISKAKTLIYKVKPQSRFIKNTPTIP